MPYNRQRGISIFARILLIFLAVNFSTCGVILFMAYSFHRQSIEERTKENVTQQLAILRDKFEDDYRLGLKRALDVLVSSSIFDDYLSVSVSERTLLKKKIELMFLQTIKTNNTFRSIQFVDTEGVISIAAQGNIRKKMTIDLKQISDQPREKSHPLIRASTDLFNTLETIPLLLSGGYMEWFMVPRELHIEGPYENRKGSYSLLAGVSKLDLDIGSFGGVLMIEQQLDVFFSVLREVKFFNENLIWVFDAAGQLLQRPAKEEYRYNPANYMQEKFQNISKLIDSKDGLIAYQDFSIIPGNSFIRLAISIPNNLLLKDFSSAIQFFSIVLICSIFMMLVVAFYVSRYLSKPIVELADAANQLAGGNLGTRVKIKSTGEVQLLVDSFNLMVEELQQKILLNVRLDEASKRKDELEQANLELEMAKESLAERELRYRMLTGNLPGIVYRLDLSSNNKLTFFNEMLYPMTGYRDNELISAKICALEAIILEDDIDIASAIVNSAVLKMEPFEIEYKVIDKKGVIKNFLERGRPVHNPDGKPQYIDGVILDVTERVAADREKKKLESQLLQAQKMEAVGTLAGGVAHDLNNILSGIVGYPDLLLVQLPPDSPLIKPILTIKKTGEKAAAVVNDLLTLARRGITNAELINLNNIIEDYLVSPEFDKLKLYHSGVDFETHLDETLLNIIAPPVHVVKTVMNLISNAVESIEENGIVKITTENRYLDTQVNIFDNVKEGDYVVLSISDNGKGISPKDIKKIFEPFYTNKKMGRSGTGLGLAVVWGVVKDLKGYIDVNNNVGGGAVFTLYFPVSRKELVQAKPQLSFRSLLGNGESVLVVDDVEEQRQIATEMLTSLQYDAFSLASGEEAVEYMQNHHVDLLVLDMIMEPGIDGLETYQRIIECHPSQKAIIASGFSDTERVTKAQTLGANIYLRKPYTIEKIGIAIKTALN